MDCLSCREVFCTMDSRCNLCVGLSPEQFQRLLESIRDRTERRKGSSASGKKRKTAASTDVSRQLQKRMCKMEEILDRLSRTFLSPLQVSPFSGFQAPTQVDRSQLRTSGEPQPGPGPSEVLQLADGHGGGGQRVPAAEMDVCLAPGHGSGKPVHDVQGTFGTVYSSGVCDSQSAPMPGGRPPTEDTDVGSSHTAPMPGGQTPILDIEGGVCPKAPMPGGHSHIPSTGLSTGKTIPVFTVVGFGHGHFAPMHGGQPTTREKDVGTSHTTPFSGGQTTFRDVDGGVGPTAPMPGGEPLLPHQGVGHGNATTGLGGFPPGHAYGGASLYTPAPDGRSGILDSGFGQGPLASMTSGQPPSLAETCENDEDEGPPLRSLFLLLYNSLVE